MKYLRNNTKSQNIHYHPGDRDSKLLLAPGKTTPVDDKHLEDSYIKSLIRQGILTSVEKSDAKEESLKSQAFNVKEASAKILDMKTVDEIKAFIEGDSRKGVLETAQLATDELEEEA